MVSNIPLAERLRPQKLEDYIGQEHIIGPNGVLSQILESGNLPSMIFWGPPGVGKTTLARLISLELKRPMYTLSAVHSGVKDVREAIENAKKQKFFNSPKPILFIDEIHRFSKSQQDSLLSAVEQGIVSLIGATTENPSFEVISPLLSRCQVYILNPLEEKDMEKLIKRALASDAELKLLKIKIEQTEALYRFAGGDARKLLNIIELMAFSNKDLDEVLINNSLVTEKLQQHVAFYDKDGEMHYDIISAFIKSIRGSDPNAGIYWLARMLDGGEDIKFIARRLIILAAEDIGLANPNALLLANNCFQAINVIGMPEARIILAETVIYLASSPKSNSAYMAIDEALEFVKKTGNQPVPLQLRNAPTKLMKQMGYGAEYQYSHMGEGNFIAQEFFPESIGGQSFYRAGKNQHEEKAREFLLKRWKNKYNF
ncbi:MAG: replication-associated recombination protein A [Bacteroidales bacterium]